jgi:hypothetical protein
MCVQVPIVKPPKLSDVLFADEEETEGQNRKRDAEKSGIRNINVDDEIDDLDQPLFPDTEILVGQQNSELESSRFFEIQNETRTEDGWTTQVYDEEFVTQSYYNEYEYNQVIVRLIMITITFSIKHLKLCIVDNKCLVRFILTDILS